MKPLGNRCPALSPIELQFLCNEIGELILTLVTQLGTAEAAIFKGTHDIEGSFRFIVAASSVISELETVYNILEHSKANGSDPLSYKDATRSLSLDQTIVERAINALVADEILNSHTPTGPESIARNGNKDR